MARPQRNNVDYFPYSCKQGNTSKYIDNTYGNDGLAVWVRILRMLAITDHHFLDLSKRKNFMTLVSECKVSEDLLTNIINDLVEFGSFDEELWRHRILWSAEFTDSIRDAYAKRSNKVTEKEEVIQMVDSLRVRKPHKQDVSDTVNPQSKVKETKEEKTREEETILYAGAETPALNVWPVFDDFWELYDKKVDRSKCEKKWEKINHVARKKIMQHLPNYIRGTPDKKYRRDPATYLNNQSWENELLTNGSERKSTSTNKHNQHTAGLANSFLKTYGSVLTGRQDGSGGGNDAPQD